VEEPSSLTSQPAGLSITNFCSQRDQHTSRRKQSRQDSSSINIDSSNPDFSQNTNDQQQGCAEAGGSSSPALCAVQFETSQSFSNEESESISFSNSNLEGINRNHNITHPEEGLNFSHSVNESINATNMTSSSTDIENSHHHLLFENMRQEEYDLHKHTQGTARFNKQLTACIELAHILENVMLPKRFSMKSWHGQLSIVNIYQIIHHQAKRSTVNKKKAIFQ